MSRIKAFSIHLGISGVIYIALLYLIVFHWYPHPFFAADGGWQGVQIVTGVDLVLGPLLTLIVFKSGKRGLKLDLTLIGLLQAVVLTWGTWLVYDQRTALVTYADGIFYSLNSKQIEAAGEGARRASQSASSPAYAFVRLAEDKQVRLRQKLKITFSGIPLFLRGDLYEPLDANNLPEVLAHSLDMEKLARESEEQRKELDDFRQRHGQNLSGFAFLPLHCRYKDIILVLRRSDGRAVDSLNIDTLTDI